MQTQTCKSHTFTQITTARGTWAYPKQAGQMCGHASEYVGKPFIHIKQTDTQTPRQPHTAYSLSGHTLCMWPLPRLPVAQGACTQPLGYPQCCLQFYLTSCGFLDLGSPKQASRRAACRAVTPLSSSPVPFPLGAVTGSQWLSTPAYRPDAYWDDLCEERSPRPNSQAFTLTPVRKAQLLRSHVVWCFGPPE